MTTIGKICIQHVFRYAYITRDVLREEGRSGPTDIQNVLARLAAPRLLKAAEVRLGGLGLGPIYETLIVDLGVRLTPRASKYPRALMDLWDPRPM